MIKLETGYKIRMAYECVPDEIKREEASENAEVILREIGKRAEKIFTSKKRWLEDARLIRLMRDLIVQEERLMKEQDEKEYYKAKVCAEERRSWELEKEKQEAKKREKIALEANAEMKMKLEKARESRDAIIQWLKERLEKAEKKENAEQN